MDTKVILTKFSQLPNDSKKVIFTNIETYILNIYFISA